MEQRKKIKKEHNKRVKKKTRKRKEGEIERRREKKKERKTGMYELCGSFLFCFEIQSSFKGMSFSLLMRYETTL